MILIDSSISRFGVMGLLWQDANLKKLWSGALFGIITNIKKAAHSNEKISTQMGAHDLQNLMTEKHFCDEI